jgi:hypothetical protein
MTPFTRRHSEEYPAGSAGDPLQLAQGLADAAVPGLADLATVELSDTVRCGERAWHGVQCARPTLRRAAFRSVHCRGCRPAYAIGDASRLPAKTPYRKCVKDLRPRIVRDLSSQPRWLARDPDRARRIEEAGLRCMMVVPLAVQGLVLGLATFYRRAGSPPFRKDDLRAATELAERTARGLDLMRRRIQWEDAGRELQRSLLPEELPSVTAAPAIGGQVSSGGSVGAWFDAIPLPGARIALVVGVAGDEGLGAAARMGWLRAVIGALARLDMAPSELLARVNGIAADSPSPPPSQGCSTAADDEPADAGDHCLYLVYDPVNGRCTVSRAGDVCLQVVTAQGKVTTPYLPEHGTLGSSDEPFEEWEFQVHPDSVLLLGSAGEAPEPAPQTRFGPSSRAVPNWSGHPVQAVLDDYARVLLPDHCQALLAARTRTLDSHDIASLRLPHDLAAVVVARAWTRRQLQGWGLDGLDFSTTLLASELVTNAIRYSTGPVELRLIRDRALVCEVSDTSSAAPHPRHPKAGDQGGRGLLIVTEIAEAVGTRYTSQGKIVWAEQAL